MGVSYNDLGNVPSVIRYILGQHTTGCGSSEDTAAYTAPTDRLLSYYVKAREQIREPKERVREIPWKFLGGWGYVY